jgi:Kef-type K+ transport system membrane component KefB
MPGSFELALYSILLITAGGVASIALARVSGVHPAYFFAACGVISALFLPFTFPPQSLLIQLSELGALFVIFLAALEIEWDIRSSLNRRTVLLGFVLQLMAALPVMAFFFFVLRSDATAAITAGIIAAMHAPDRGRPAPAERFLTNRISGEIGLMGLISEITALVGVSLLIAWAPPRRTTGNLLQEAVGVILILLILVSFLPPALRFLVKRTGEESYALFYLMLVLLVSVTIGVRQAGIEPLFGAYAAGFVLTRFVAEGSRVLERLRFTGHSIIVPLSISSWDFPGISPLFPVGRRGWERRRFLPPRSSPAQHSPTSGGWAAAAGPPCPR